MKKKKTVEKKKSQKKTKSLRKEPQSHGKNLSPLEVDTWPDPRDVFFRPERMNYVRKGTQGEGCVFCKAAEQAPSFESLCVYRSTHSMIILNKYPYNTGHLLVLPRSHCASLLDLGDAEYVDLQNLLKIALDAVYAIYKPNAVNIGMNHGRASGAGIPEHLHYHVIPRWNGDTNFFPLIAQTKVLVETLDQTYQRVSEFFLKKEKNVRN